jgi:hypothetical protein
LLVPNCGTSWRGYAREVARSLAHLNPTASVKLVHLPGLEEGEDIEQWLGRRPADGTPGQTLDSFEALAAASTGPLGSIRRGTGKSAEMAADGGIRSGTAGQRTRKSPAGMTQGFRILRVAPCFRSGHDACMGLMGKTTRRYRSGGKDAGLREDERR